MKFFVISTEAIAAQVESKGRSSYTSSGKTPRPKSIGNERKKAEENPDSSRFSNKSPPTFRQSGEKPVAKRRPSNSETSRGLPPLNPLVSASKPPSAPTKPTQTRTKLPKLNSKKTSPTKEQKSQPTSLPPLSARSNSSLASAGQDYSSRKNSVISNDGRDEPNVILVADYGFLVVQLEKAIIEWKKLYSKRILQVIVTWLRSQIDQLRYSVVPPPNHKTTIAQQQHSALFLLHSQLNHTTIEITPSLDDIQDVVHTAGKIMLCVAKGIRLIDTIDTT